MGLLLNRSIEVGGGNKLAKIGIALVVLGQQREPIDTALPANLARPGDRQQRADDRLHPFGETGVAEGHDPYKPLRSVSATAGNPSFAVRSAIVFGSIAPSSMVKEENTRSGTNG